MKIKVKALSLLVGIISLPVFSAPAVTIIPQPTIGETIAASAALPGRWVVDIGGPCSYGACIVQSPSSESVVGSSVEFLITPNGQTAQVDASVGIRNNASGTPNSWDLSKYSGITFYYKDYNGQYSYNGKSALSHYFLMYDNNSCYREWVINLVNSDGSPTSGSPTIAASIWYQISGSFQTPQGSYVIQGGIPKNGVPCNSVPLDFSNITYFETGIFGGAIRPGDGVKYNWLVGTVTPTLAPQ
ncbi:hypothetical protein QN382_22455 [Pseudomonas sp. 10B1]|uniref:hypothetical protein n=1 Tax=unclassified Pseudomonas TaxID=196821 RepID=UPI002B2390CB|nr:MULTISPECIES: hypothetical protein [unclassified Pseudomonas]MEA9997032.1 hypothetical protein [Pseudomonas sp. AA4]MEB0089222.1 hypothetical protein [Pseudomonas sp. RTI1]MEB0128414.1 hypothetical protein [Pseudomonas sp. CCC1.2]MEB0155312.1 hypothetical protein [Pseudomonas sp. CCC4.3]MEB0221680.1 hypothetical protein [Pseudomonas sp. AB12(2023)]